MHRRRRDIALFVAIVALLVSGNGFVAGQNAVGAAAAAVALIALALARFGGG